MSRNKYPEQTVERILDAAQRLFLEKGYEATTIQDIVDELGGMEEVEQLEQGFYGGVNFVASLHASTLEEAAHRPQVERLTLRRMLRVLVLLEGRQSPGRVKEVRWI